MTGKEFLLKTRKTIGDEEFQILFMIIFTTMGKSKYNKFLRNKIDINLLKGYFPEDTLKEMLGDD